MMNFPASNGCNEAHTKTKKRTLKQKERTLKQKEAHTKTKKRTLKQKDHTTKTKISHTKTKISHTKTKISHTKTKERTLKQKHALFLIKICCLQKLALRKLWSFTRLLQTIFLAFLHSWITREQTSFF